VIVTSIVIVVVIAVAMLRIAVILTFLFSNFYSLFKLREINSSKNCIVLQIIILIIQLAFK
jgi:ABC-type microcin C transport system permease subunit YejB